MLIEAYDRGYHSFYFLDLQNSMPTWKYLKSFTGNQHDFQLGVTLPMGKALLIGKNGCRADGKTHPARTIKSPDIQVIDHQAAAVALPGGKVLLVRGQNSQKYNVATSTWGEVEVNMELAHRSSVAMAPLPSRRVLHIHSLQHL